MNPTSNTGRNSPLGATVRSGGVNFSLFSRSASGVDLLFFDREDNIRPARVIGLDPALNSTYHDWRILMAGEKTKEVGNL
jgi:isoamylase